MQTSNRIVSQETRPEEKSRGEIMQQHSLLDLIRRGNGPVVQNRSNIEARCTLETTSVQSSHIYSLVSVFSVICRFPWFQVSVNWNIQSSKVHLGDSLQLQAFSFLPLSAHLWPQKGLWLTILDLSLSLCWMKWFGGFSRVFEKHSPKHYRTVSL
jgi:hypothetical protein